MSREVDTSTVGKVDLENTEPESGPEVVNLQREKNSLDAFTGRPAESAFDATPVWNTNEVGTSGDNLKERAEALTDKFDEVTGHAHTGAPGDGAPVVAEDLADVRLRGYYARATDLTAVTGTSKDVSAEMAGKVNSSGATVKGVVVTFPNNKIILRDATDATEDEVLVSAARDVIYGRLTYAASVWTLSFYTSIEGVETAYNFTDPADIAWYYQELFNPITDAPVYEVLASIERDGVPQSGAGFVTISPVGDGGDYEFDGSAASYHAAADDERIANGGTLFFFPGTYTFADTPTWRSRVLHLGSRRQDTIIDLPDAETSTGEDVAGIYWFKELLLTCTAGTHEIIWDQGMMSRLENSDLGGDCRWLPRGADLSWSEIINSSLYCSGNLDWTSAQVYMYHCFADGNTISIEGGYLQAIGTYFNVLDFAKASTSELTWRLVNCEIVQLTNSGGFETRNNYVTGCRVIHATGIPDFIQGVFSGNSAGSNREYYDHGNETGATSINWKSANETGNTRELTLTGNITLTLTGADPGREHVLKLVQDGTGGRLATWPGSVIWLSGAAPVLSTAPGAVDVIKLLFDGTNFYGWKAGAGSGGGAIPSVKIEWQVGTDSPELVTNPDLNGLKAFRFEQGLGQKLYVALRVNNSYIAGSPINLSGMFYSPGTSGDVEFQSITTLIQTGIDEISDVTKQNTDLETISLGSPSEKVLEFTLELSDGSGNINGTAVSPGDLLLVEFTRQAGDTAAFDAYLMFDATEVTWQ